ncbi:CHASE domain-containing protein [Methylobacter sp. G7]|uniref:CHASE domain-containing protein n=1 Tax=Methylobacter sp. G7 TaxID=3230117 RepID=UPI003D807233
MSKNNDKLGTLFSTAKTSVLSLSWLLQIIGLTAAYFATGKLGTALAIPPGYATAIWPPSGIALAGILLYGNRVWPAILLGSFLVNISTPLIAPLPIESLYSAIITLIISGGASLQAVVGAYLVRRFADFPNSFTREKEVFLFFLFGGLFSALVNATIAVSTLVAIGGIPAANFLANWRTWWMGDALGIFIFTPLILVWAQPSSDPWRNRRIAITLPVIAMFILTTTVVFFESKNNNDRLKLEFNQRAFELKVALETSVFDHLNVIRSIGSFYSASSIVSRQEFKAFVTHSLDDFEGIQALEWSPVIQASERNALEKSVRLDGYPNFQITERDADKSMVRAGNRQKYIPITFLEPYQGNESALGYDFNSNALRRDALDKARDTGELTITARVNLVQEKSNQYGLIAYSPIYRTGLSHQTLEERRNNISGYAVGIFRAGDIAAAALKDLDLKGLSYRLIDESVPATEQLLFSIDWQELSPWALPERSFFGKRNPLVSHSSIKVGDRSWRFEVAPTQDYFTSHRSGNAWLILLAGLILTSIVSAFAMVVSGRGNLLRKLVEERTTELAQSEQRFRIVADAAPMLIWLADTDKRCFWFNQVWLDFTGHAMEQESGNGWRNGIHPNDLQRYLDSYVSYFDRHQPFHMEYRLKRHDGEYRWIEDHGVPRFNADQTFAGYIGSCIDVTDKIIALNAASSAKEELENVLSAATEISIISTDADGVITTFNRGAELMLGYSAEEMIGKHTPALLHTKKEVAQRSRELALELGRPIFGFEVFAEQANQSEQGKREWTYVRKDRSTLTVSLAVTAILSQDGKTTGYLGIAEDISQRKQNEAIVLLAKDRAETLAKSKSQFLANMSHEIRTPMNAIIGLSYLALNKEVSDDARNYLEKINSSANSLLNIINDILDFSRLEAERLTIEHNAIDLDAILDNLSNLFADSAKEKRIGFSITVAPNAPSNLIGDALRLQQILINLLSNAIKFTERGTVMLAITLQQLDPSEARLLFCVTDTGIGMSDTDHAKLFQPFSQVDGSITRRFGGTGLGLAISHNLLQLMGSEFSVTSTLGLGTSFGFELVLGLSPLSSKDKSETPTLPRVDLSKLLVGTRILVAEDNLINQQIVKEFLTLSGIIVEMANNGNEALALLENGEFDAVLMDIHMPVLDGFEATKMIRSQARFARLPIIALTAAVTTEEQNRYRDSGMNDFIAKPINPKKLMSTLVQWIKPLERTTETATDGTTAEPIIAKLSSSDDLPGFDMHNLLLMLDNNKALATRLLRTFMKNMEDVPDEIAAMMTVGNLVAAEELLHKIKGASGNIGAVGLYDAAEALETELNGELSAAMFDTFKEVFNQTMSVIATLHLHEALLLPTGANSKALTRNAAELDLLLKENNFISDVMLNTLKSHLADDQLAWFAQLRKLINDFQYAEARKILRQLKKYADSDES